MLLFCSSAAQADQCTELKISGATLYRYVSPSGELRDHARKVLGA